MRFFPCFTVITRKEITYLLLIRNRTEHYIHRNHGHSCGNPILTNLIVSMDLECQSKFAPKKLPVVIDKINPHMLRHTYATMLYNAGVDIMTASELLGHADIETTLKIYTELRKNTKKHSIGKFDDYIKKTFKRKQDEEKSNEKNKESDETEKSDN